MNKIAEEAGMKAYPVRGKWVGNQYGYWDGDINMESRQRYIEGYVQAEKNIIAIVKQYIEKGERCMEQEGESQIYTFWDGFHNCAENILRELEEK